MSRERNQPRTPNGKRQKAGSKRKDRDALPHYTLRLYVAGITRVSSESVERVRALCEEHLPGQYDLEVIDIFQLPELARSEHIVATPTLIRVLPPPLRRYIGNLPDDKIIVGLELREKEP